MTTTRTLQTPLSQQALALGLAAVVTFGLLAGVLGEAAGDTSARLAQRLQPVPQAIATALVAPQA